MDFHGQKVNLSFSIENILRDDFSHPRRENIANLPTRESSFADCWRNPPVYRCYAVPYSPVFMKYLPATNRVGLRLHRVNGAGEDYFLPEQTSNRFEDDCLSCKDEEIQKDNDAVSDKEFIQESKSVKCFSENGTKRKRRNRSHFTQRQLQYLEKIFSRQQYLTRDERTLLARGLEMTELQIRNWFQNRRYQRRHRANEDKKQDEPDTSVTI